MNSAQRTGELRLCVLKGVIWHQEPGQAPWPETLSPHNFARQKVILDTESIRLLGSRDNAGLITALHAIRCATGTPTDVQLGNPAWAPKVNAQGVEAAAAIGRCMAGQEASPGVGGWHQLNEKDYATFHLIAEFEKAGFKCTPMVELQLRDHPAWPALSFLPDLSKVAACHLIRDIVDPRWHVDPVKPDRHGKLRAHMGLGRTAATFGTALLQGDATPEMLNAIQYQRLKTVMDTWTGGNYVPPAQDVVGPDGFLWRVYYGVAESKGGFYGMMRACNAFLRFLRSVWLDNLTGAREYESVAKRFKDRPSGRASCTQNVSRLLPCRAYCPTLFVPEHYFRLKAEVEAWKQHVARCHEQGS